MMVQRPNAKLQYLEWKKYPRSTSEPTHELWLEDFTTLEQRVRELAAEIAEPSIKELDVLYRIRQAVGDNGKMMQDDLVNHIAGLSKKVRELEADLADANKDIDTATESVKVLMEANDELEAEKKQKQPVVGDCKRNPRLLEAENARLRKRLEPIEAAYNTYKEYPTSAIVKRDAYNQAINRCMEIGEGK